MRKALLLIILVYAMFPAAGARAEGVSVQVLDASNVPISTTVDGNGVRLRAGVLEPAAQTETIVFRLAGLEPDLATCTIAAGQSSCVTEVIRTLGWYWNVGGTASPQRVIEAYQENLRVGTSDPFEVRSRPVVMVHGFSSSWEAWQTYLGTEGFLARIGIQGFAVGDEQVEGVLNTGSITAPENPTNTIAENAAITGQYIAQVKETTGAEMVDLVAHSMGGLISRYYIGRLMEERDVAQLIMLGSPMAGTECAYLPSSLGYYLPAVLEIRPSYVVEIFNRQVTERRGVPFNAVAGVPITRPIQSPCTEVPSDLVISRSSISAIPLNVTETTFLHTDLNRSLEVFEEAVAPLLQSPPGSLGVDLADPGPGENSTGQNGSLQFSRIFSGNLQVGEIRELVIPIEAGLTVARFALFDTSRSLAVEVFGARGNVIELSLENHGFTVVDDPSTLVYLGYGFASPNPGEWRVRLRTTADTPPEGAYFALTAVFDGGAELRAETSKLVPETGEQLVITARLLRSEAGLQTERVQARIYPVGGIEETLDLKAEGDAFTAAWAPSQVGLHAIDVEYQGHLPDGSPIQRIAFLVIEVQPEEGGRIETLLLFVGGILAFVIGMVFLFVRRSRKKRQRSGVV